MSNRLPTLFQDDEETIKVTFTYYGSNPDRLSDTINQDGLKVSTEEILQQNQRRPATSNGNPSERRPGQNVIPSAWMPSEDDDHRPSSSSKHVGFVDCDAFPRRHHHGDDFEHPPTPINPPNSPSQLREGDTTGIRTRDDFDSAGSGQQKDVWVRPHTTPASNEMPLILQAHYDRLGGSVAVGNKISVVGHGLNEGMTSSGYPKTPSSYILGVKGGPRSARKAFRGKRRHPPPQLPKVSAFGPVPAPNSASPVLNNALQMRLIEKNRLHDSDKPKQRLFTPSPRLEFINVVNPLAPTCASSPTKEPSPSPQTPRPFDTDKLRINSSLEEIRPELVRSPITSRKSKEARPPECGGGTAGKDYLLQKYIGEAHARAQCLKDDISYRPGYPDGIRKSGHFGNGSKQSTQSTETVDLSIGNSKPGEQSSTSPPSSPSAAVQYQFFKQRTPGNFRHRCLKACDEFVIRKEQITSSRLYSTVTSITVNRVPTGGFGQWKFIDCGTK